MSIWIRNLYWKCHLSWYDLTDKYGRYLPKIATRKPAAPHNGYCPKCRKLFAIHAYNTGDGWDFWWDCENEHWLEEDITHITGWFPFVFGWANGKDLAKIGIMEE